VIKINGSYIYPFMLKLLVSQLAERNS